MKMRGIYLLVFASCLAMWGCGATTASRACPQYVFMAVVPATATADHAAAPPGNQVRFQLEIEYPPGCGTNQTVPATWTVSDTTDVNFSSTTDGLATCVNPTPGSVTVTGTGSSAHGMAQLTCK